MKQASHAVARDDAPADGAAPSPAPTHPPHQERLAALGIRAISCPVPFAAAGGPVNLWVVDEDGGGVALFDCGLGWAPGERAVREGLAALGLSTRDVRRIVLSHGHVDHYGLAAPIAAESGAPVLVHDADRDKVTLPRDRPREALRRELVRLGLDEAGLEAAASLHRSTLALARPVEHVLPLTDGAVLRFARFSARVLHAPGHTPGLACLHDEQNKVLFSGDHLLERTSPNPLIEVLPDGSRFAALPSYLRSLGRVRALDVDLVLPGHNGVFTGHRRLVDTLLGFYERRQAKILGHLESGPGSAAELVRRVFPRLQRIDLFLALSEIVGNLEVLREKGRVVCDDDGGVLRWHAAA